ncbi:MAG: hypothetical protein H7Y01_07435 [Ferruginibacter sp.]|nr:hypothetical protein [Chitinophagaceae bacterium]
MFQIIPVLVSVSNNSPPLIAREIGINTGSHYSKILLILYVFKATIMLNSPVFETILSLVFIILIFSVLVSCVQEGFVTIFKLRGKMLQFAIKEMLNDRFNKNFSYLLYQHPRIDLLKQKQGDLPGYISAENFSSALIDLIANESTETIYRKNDGLMVKKEVLKTSLFKNSPTLERLNISADTATTSEMDPSVIPVVEKFNAGLQSLKQSELKKLLQSFTRPDSIPVRGVVEDVASDLDQLKKNIEKWFNSYMERVTGWYKKKVRKNIFFVAIVVTLGFNLNFITLTKTVYADSNLRGALADMADNAAQTDSFIVNMQNKIGKNKSLGEINMNAVIGIELPIGWKASPCTTATEKNWLRQTWAQAGCFFRNEFTLGNVLGWLLFVLALSLGAPFWFDLLKKIVNIRNSGISPTESKPK